jgi:hypothetical protein
MINSINFRTALLMKKLTCFKRKYRLYMILSTQPRGFLPYIYMVESKPVTRSSIWSLPHGGGAKRPLISST